MIRCIAAGLSVVLIGAVTAIYAQEQPQFPGPEKEHTWLKQFVGEWSTKSKGDMGPGQPPMEVTGSISSRMIGKFWVLNEMKGDMKGTTFVGMQTIGYDPAKKKYVGTWVDSMSNYMWRYEGTVDKTGKILTLEAEGPNFMVAGKMSKFRDIYEFKTDDEMVTKSQMLGDDDKWNTFMTGTAQRKKKNRE